MSKTTRETKGVAPKPNNVERFTIYKINELLQNNYVKYLNANRIAKDLDLNWRTVRSALILADKLELFRTPVCCWHIEDDKENWVGDSYKYKSMNFKGVSRK